MDYSVCGVVVGCDRRQEWLLPWWYMNFRLHNTYPVCFVDFGDMSQQAQAWCQSRGGVAKLTCGSGFIARKEAVDSGLAKAWETRRSRVWELRKAWFKIPFALLQTPFDRSVWMDLDCQVRGPLAFLFNEGLKDAEFAVAPEGEGEQAAYRAAGELLPGEVIYNAGVAAYRRDSAIVQEWAEKAFSENDKYMGCQKLLAGILLKRKGGFYKFPSIYNWPLAQGENNEAIVLHHWGAYQERLKKHINFLKNKLYIDLSI